MGKEEKRSRMPQIGEAIFCIAYLLFDLIAAVVFFVNADGHTALYLFGILTLVLGGGDAFHLVPRIVKAFRGGSPAIEWWTGLGLMVSSITMTIFYVLLFYVWKALFPNISYPSLLPILLWCSAVVRIVLCLFPQNNWFRPEGNPAWGIYRNLPFLITGLCVVVLFFLSGNSGDYGLWKMSIAIIISFSCYMPVVFFAKRKPAVGMLMMPKTAAYVWMILMGLGLIGVNHSATEELVWDKIPMVMVDGSLYYDTGKESAKTGRCGTMDGEITSTVDGAETPTENNQSNFGTGFEYQYGIDNTIEISINEKWIVFEQRPKE